MLDLNVTSDKNDKKSKPEPLITPKAIATEETEKSVSKFMIMVVIVLLVATGLFYGYDVWQKSQLKTNQTKYTDLLTQMSVKDLADVDVAAQQIQTGLIAIEAVLGNQYSYSKLLTALQKTTPKNVKLNNFSVDEKNNVKLDGVTSDFSSVGIAMASFGDSGYFSDVKMTSSGSSFNTSGQQQVTFNLEMKLDKSKLK